MCGVLLLHPPQLSHSTFHFTYKYDGAGAGRGGAGSVKATAHCQDSPQRGSGSVCARTRPAPAERRRVNESGPNIDRVSILPPPSLPSSLHPRTANVAARQRTARPRQGTRPLLFVSPQQQGSCPGRASTRHHIVNNNNGPLPPHCCEVGCRVLVLLGQSPIKVICYFLYVQCCIWVSLSPPGQAKQFIINTKDSGYFWRCGGLSFFVKSRSLCSYFSRTAGLLRISLKLTYHLYLLSIRDSGVKLHLLGNYSLQECQT